MIGRGADMLRRGLENENLKPSKKDKFKSKNRKGIYLKEKGEKLTFKKVSKEKIDEIKKRYLNEIKLIQIKNFKILLFSVALFIVITIVFINALNYYEFNFRNEYQ